MLLQDKVFFGSDFPVVITPARWIKEFAELPFKDSVRPKILRDNFVKFMGIELPGHNHCGNCSWTCVLSIRRFATDRRACGHRACASA